MAAARERTLSLRLRALRRFPDLSAHIDASDGAGRRQSGVTLDAVEVDDLRQSRFGQIVILLHLARQVVDLLALLFAGSDPSATLKLKRRLLFLVPVHQGDSGIFPNRTDQPSNAVSDPNCELVLAEYLRGPTKGKYGLALLVDISQEHRVPHRQSSVDQVLQILGQPKRLRWGSLWRGADVVAWSSSAGRLGTA